MNILLVEDHRLFRDGMSMLLEKIDAKSKILEAATGQQALDYLDDNNLDLDLAVIDYQLPDTSGINILAAIKLHLPATPVVIMSGLDSPDIIRSTLARGASGFLPKIMEPEEIIDALRLVIDGAFYVPPFIIDRIKNNPQKEDYSDLTQLAERARQIMMSDERGEQSCTSTPGAINSIHLALDKMQQQSHEFRHQAFHDHLTGLPNRRLFDDRLQQTLKQTRRNKKLFALVALDLDKFKQINDNFGHATGDLLLEGIADRLRQSLRRADTAARLGGDEFVLILREVSDFNSVDQIVNRLQKNLCRPITLAGQKLSPSVSMGVCISQGKESSAQLLDQADRALYKAKACGRNNYQIYKEDLPR